MPQNRPLTDPDAWLDQQRNQLDPDAWMAGQTPPPAREPSPLESATGAFKSMMPGAAKSVGRMGFNAYDLFRRAATGGPRQPYPKSLEYATPEEEMGGMIPDTLAYAALPGSLPARGAALAGRLVTNPLARGATELLTRAGLEGAGSAGVAALQGDDPAAAAKTSGGMALGLGVLGKTPGVADWLRRSGRADYTKMFIPTSPEEVAMAERASNSFFANREKPLTQGSLNRRVARNLTKLNEAKSEARAGYPSDLTIDTPDTVAALQAAGRKHLTTPVTHTPRPNTEGAQKVIDAEGQRILGMESRARAQGAPSGKVFWEDVDTQKSALQDMARKSYGRGPQAAESMKESSKKRGAKIAADALMVELNKATPDIGEINKAMSDQLAGAELLQSKGAKEITHQPGTPRFVVGGPGMGGMGKRLLHLASYMSVLGAIEAARKSPGWKAWKGASKLRFAEMMTRGDYKGAERWIKAAMVDAAATGPRPGEKAQMQSEKPTEFDYDAESGTLKARKP